jgi:hypothetical protein
VGLLSEARASFDRDRRFRLGTPLQKLRRGGAPRWLAAWVHHESRWRGRTLRLRWPRVQSGEAIVHGSWALLGWDMATRDEPGGPTSDLRVAFHRGDEPAIGIVRAVLYGALRQAHMRPDEAASCATKLVGDVWLDVAPRSADNDAFLCEVRRLAWRWARREQRRAHLPLEAARRELVHSTDAASRAAREELRVLLGRVYRSLAPEARRFFRVRYSEPATLRASSARLGLSYHRVRCHEAHIRAMLRSGFEP